MFKNKVPAAMVGLVLAVFLAYGPSLHNQFVNWDDDAHLFANPFVQSFNLQDIFTTTVNGIYLPLTSLSFALEYHFFKDQPFIYHFDNVLLHAAVTVMVLLFSLRCGLSLRASVVAALIFGLHPARVESVAWVTERKDVLYAFFYMIALLCYLRHIRALPSEEGGGYRRGWPFRLTIIFGFLSVLAKPMALSLPLVLLLCDWFFRRKWNLRCYVEKIYCGLAVFPVAWMTYLLQMRAPAIHLPDSVLIWIWSFVFYIQKTFFPDFFVLIYHLPAPVALTSPGYGLAVFIFIVLGWSLWCFRKNRPFVFANLFYALSIFFLLRLDHNADINIVGDRFLYLPMLGWCMFAGAAYDQLLLRWGKRPIAAGLLRIAVVTVSAFLFFRTSNQTRVWYNGASLWEHQLKYQKQAATALIYSKLAEAYTGEKDFLTNPSRMAMVRDCLEKAIAIKPDYAQAYFQLGRLSLLQKDPAAARVYLGKAVAFDAAHFEGWFELGRLNDAAGQYDPAVQDFHRAVEINPDNRRMYRLVLDFYGQALATGREVYRPHLEKLTEEYKGHFDKR